MGTRYIGYINEFLDKQPEIRKEIERLAEKYKLSDFVLADKNCKDYFEDKNDDAKLFSGIILDIKKESFRLDVESYERRLTNDYLEFLDYLIKDKSIENKVFYIVAFHVLTLGKYYGYKLTGADDCPFPVSRNGEITPFANKKLEMLFDDNFSFFIKLIPFMYSKDLIFFHNFYTGFEGNHHHATKHFSLVAEIINPDIISNEVTFYTMAENLIDAFAFNYKALFTVEKISIYSSKGSLDNIRNNLFELEL